MKENVDLSENGMFTTPKQPTGVFKQLLDMQKITKPWDFENNFSQCVSDFDLKFKEPLFALGNKKERQIWKRNRAYDTDQICDCCGRSRGNKPWKKIRCNCYSTTHFPEIPWKF